MRRGRRTTRLSTTADEVSSKKLPMLSKLPLKKAAVKRAPSKPQVPAQTATQPLKPRVPAQAARQPLKKQLMDLRAVLFLDVDGVLHSNRIRHVRQYFSPVCMELLAEVVQATGCVIVLSTSWRLEAGPRRTVSMKLREAGLQPPVSRTPSIAQFKRGTEILRWVDQYKPQAWVALDDWPLLLETAVTKRLEGHFVQTRAQHGLQQDTKDQLIQMFEQQQIPKVEQLSSDGSSSKAMT